MKPKYIKNLQTQSKQLTVQRTSKNTFVVASRSDPAARHTVTIRAVDDGEIFARCDCEWAEHQGIACAHVMAALDTLAARRGRKLSFWLTVEDAERQKHRTFRLVGRGQDDGVWITSRSA